MVQLMPPMLMRASSRTLIYALLAVLTCAPPLSAQLRPHVTSPTNNRKPASQLPTEIRVERNPTDGLRYVYIPAGTFTMGCSRGDLQCRSEEKPAHQVAISKGFWLGQTEVTVGAFKRFAAATGHEMPPAPFFSSGWANDNMPILSGSWDDAQAYCRWAGGRLPTEAEWEYAARAGTEEARYGAIDEIAWYDKNSADRPHEVGQKRANAWGLFDMLGNAWEWVNDWYNKHYYRKSPSTDPQGPKSAEYKVLRGGSWYGGVKRARVSYRVVGVPGGDGFGFRCAREVTNP